MNKKPTDNIPEIRPSSRPHDFPGFVAEVLAWLADSEALQERLVQWLQGLGGIPSEHFGAPPAEWLYRTMQGPDQVKLREKMAVRLAELLQRQPDIHAIGELPENLLENAFHLAALLEDRERLATPLREILRRHEKQVGPLMEDHHVRLMFRVALAHNQPDRELRELWLNMLQHKAPFVAAGDEIAGIDGVLLMPAKQHYLVELASALHELARQLENDRTKRKIFFSVLDRCCEVMSGLSSIGFVSMAVANCVPIWAIECAPSLFMPLDDGSGKRARFLLWKPVSELVCKTVEYAKIEREPDGYGGIVELVSVPSHSAKTVQEWAERFEENRKQACAAGASDVEFLGRRRHVLDALAGEVSDKKLQKKMEPVQRGWSQPATSSRSSATHRSSVAR